MGAALLDSHVCDSSDFLGHLYCNDFWVDRLTHKMRKIIVASLGRIIKIVPDSIVAFLINAVLASRKLEDRLRWHKDKSLFEIHSSSENLFFTQKSRALWYSSGLNFRIRQLEIQYGLDDLFDSLKPEDIESYFVDVGANVGELSISSPGRKLQYLALEPSPNDFKALSLNCRNSHNAKALELAATSASGSMNFFLSEIAADSSLIQPEEYSSQIKVSAVRLDKLPELDGKQIFVLKVEAEGGEPEVIDGSVGILRAVRNVVIDVGFEREGKSTLAKCDQILRDNGFALRELHGPRLVAWYVNQRL